MEKLSFCHPSAVWPKSIAQNPTVEDLTVSFVEINDTEHPSIITAALNLSTGVLVVNATETLDFTPAQNVNLSFISIVNHVENALCTSCSSGINNGDRVACTGITGNTFAASGCSNDNTHNDDQFACEAGAGVFTPATCATCSLNGDSSSQVLCTGVTGNTFEVSTCSNNPTHNADQSACEASSDPSAGVFTPNKCKDKDGNVLVADGTGISGSQAACEGTANGKRYTASGGDATSRAACEGVATGDTFDTSGNAASYFLCTGLTGYAFTAAANNTCVHSDGNSTGNATSKATCTGLTENVLTPSLCDNNAANNADKDSCESGGGIFTPNICRDSDGNVLISDGTGLSASQAACEGMPTGNIFTAAHSNLCRDRGDSDAGDPTDASTCEGTANGRAFTAATDDLLSFTLNDIEAATVDLVDRVSAIITLSELQRNDAQRAGQYIGGDGIEPQIRFLPGAIRDVATNLNLDTQFMSLDVSADVVGPQLVSATIKLAEGLMVLFMSETVFMRQLDLSKIFLSNYIPVVYPATGVNIKRVASHSSAGATQLHSAQTYGEFVYNEPYVNNGKEWVHTGTFDCAFCDDGSLGHTGSTSVTLTGFNAIRSGDTSVFQPESGPFIKYKSLLSGYAMRREPGTMVLTIRGIDSGYYEFKTYHYARHGGPREC